MQLLGMWKKILMLKGQKFTESSCAIVSIAIL